MQLDAELVRSIKANFAGLPSVELRAILERRDADQYSDEAFAAAQELLDERERGAAAEPIPVAVVPLTPEELTALSDARLRRQVRLIGLWYYGFAVLCLALMALYARSPTGTLDVTLAMLLPVAFFGVLGHQLRRFSPWARGIALLISFLNLPNFPFGTIFGYYCFDKLTRGEHLFGIRRPEQYR